MRQVQNAAPESSNCDTCGEPNRTGDSIVYVSKSWCKRNRLTYSEDLKMCIWCRNQAVHGGHDWVTKPSRNRLPEVTEDIKRKKERREEIKNRFRDYKELVLRLLP